MKPFFSVVTATFNNLHTIQQCIDSVAGQTYSHYEHLIVDGASHDGTVEILKINSNKLSWWISEPDSGIYQAWNKALMRAKGEWILFIGADDRLSHNKVLKNLVPYLEKAYPTFKVIYGKINVVNASGKIVQTRGNPWWMYEGKYEQGRIKLPPHPATFHHRTLFENHGFDESLRVAGDSEFLIKELKKNPSLFVPELITEMTAGGVSGSPQNTLIRWKECRSIMEKHQLRIPFHSLIWQRIKNLSEFAIFLIFPVNTALKLVDKLCQLLGKRRI